MWQRILWGEEQDDAGIEEAAKTLDDQEFEH
jgi:hypothetical protein